jgi:hypothetical protein
MEQIFSNMLKKAVQDLKTLQAKGYAQFKIVSDIGEFGDLKIEAKKKKVVKNPSGMPHGSIRQYALPFIQAMQPGDIVSIPVGEIPAENLRGNICSWCGDKWGVKTYTTAYNKQAKTIEVYRYPEGHVAV